VFERNDERAGRPGGVIHFGFRLKRPEDIDKAVGAVHRAGGQVTSSGEFCPGEPYVFFKDPDGYEVEIWYEIPTPADPPAA
jgi:predicted enzyme related to lactoylglutathione lyase